MSVFNRGIHHITALAGDPQQNLDFYTGILGMRLVKKTVNYDDPSVYHLYYGNPTGDPGTILTFFPWENAVPGKPDNGQVVAVSFSIPEESADYWTDRFREEGIEFEEPFTRFDKEVIGFRDPDGLHLELVCDPGVSGIKGWDDGPVPAAHAIRGIHGATLSERDPGPTGRLLEETLGFEMTGHTDDRIVYETDASFGSVIEIVHGYDLNGQMGRGAVHHIAFRSEDNGDQAELRDDLADLGYHLTEVKDRNYFRSIYFHEPGGILFEIATDPPGFTVDEDPDELGTTLALPPWLEQRRDLIKANLPQLNPVT